MVRWTFADDLNLLKLMQVSFPKNPADWQIISERLSTETFVVTSRGARERWLKTLLVKFNQHNTESLKRSGTEEEYGELDVLLQDLADRQNDLNAEAVESTANERKKREEGLKLRQLSMLTLKRKQEEMSNDSASSNEPLAASSPVSEEIAVNKRRTMKQKQLDLLTYMKERDEKANELKNKELLIEQMKAENEKRRIENQSQQIDMLQQLLLQSKNK